MAVAGHERSGSPVVPPALPLREVLFVLAALALVVAAAWLSLAFRATSGHGAMEMATMMETEPRGVVHFGLLFVMWAIMMVAMMVPTAAPVVLLYAAVVRRLPSVRNAVAQTAAFVAAYMVAWAGFGLGAAALQVGLERLALLSPMMVSASPILGGALLAAAGLYQLSSLKDVCVRHCRSPIVFVTQYWRPGIAGGFRMGLRHGAYCIGCCSVLMGLLFVVGVMNLVWIAAISAFVMLEKVTGVGSVLGRRLSGLGLVAAGVLVVIVGA
jgi:predicted metal-binding membrane protein